MAEPQIPSVPRPKTPILTGVPDIVEEDDDDEDRGVVPRRLYFANSKQVMNINMVFTSNDLIPEYPQRSFCPAMVHQIFGEDGIIYGYRNLHIDIYFLANSAKCFVDLQYTEVTSADMPNHSAPDDILKKLSPWLPEKYYLDKKQFISKVLKENHTKTFGTFIDCIQLYNEKERTLHHYTYSLCTGNDPEFRKFHSRFQCMIVWYIDGVSQIDVEDPNWMFIYVYEKRRLTGSWDTGMYPVGFATIYKFFHYPDKVRARISQFFVIPPCQGAGIGSHLLKNVYLTLRNLHNVVDITVEEPCRAFTRMRDFLDCQLVMQLEPFKKSVIHNGYTNAMFVEANKQYKITKRQARRIYEILRFAYIHCDKDDVNYPQLYEEISDRLKIPLMRELRTLRRAKACDKTVENTIEALPYMEAKIKQYIKDILDAAFGYNNKLLQ